MPIAEDGIVSKLSNHSVSVLERLFPLSNTIAERF